MRDWFKLIYQVFFGEENGPRMGFFISFFGVKETIDLMKKVGYLDLMFSHVRSLIFNLDPETAHNFAIKSLKLNIIPQNFLKLKTKKC